MSSDHQKKEGDDDNVNNRLVHALYNKLHIMAVFFFFNIIIILSKNKTQEGYFSFT